MNNWREHEKKCFDYLKVKFAGESVQFSLVDQGDSTESDIKVTKSDTDYFYVEAKMRKSQCCQFVLLPDNEKQIFKYSEKNKTCLSPNCQHIIQYMNENFVTYSKAGTTGKRICIDKKILWAWLKDVHKGKNVRFVITENIRGEFIISSLESIEKYYNVEATYRAKQSGSVVVPKKDREDAVNYLKKSEAYIECLSSAEEMLVSFSKRLDESGKYFRLSNKCYYLHLSESNQNQYIYKVRKLSSTKNSNVIFSLELKAQKQSEEELKKFRDSLR
ncbi:MAG: hypothetical protein KBI09_11995 [Mesotoga sp.]|jgi:hypothetical protein|nr:hypothetical protein [Mesotoga sp.]